MEPPSGRTGRGSPASDLRSTRTFPLPALVVDRRRRFSMEIRTYPDPVLRRHAEPVDGVDDSIRDRVLQMFEFMYREGGVGLAAPQVGWSVRLFVMNPLGSEERKGEQAFINPEILEESGELVAEEEGCLSIPDLRARVRRHDRVRVRALGMDGEPFERELEGLPARIVLHEYDHLDGILFTNRLSETDRLLVRRHLKRLEKEYRHRVKESRHPARR